MIEISTNTLIQIFVFTLTFFSSFEIMTKLFKEKIISGIIGLSIALITTYFITYESIMLISKTYGFLGIILLFSLPTIIIFLFIYQININGYLRKLFWIGYGITNFFIINELLDAQKKIFFLYALIIFISIILYFDTEIKNRINAKENLSRIRS